MSRHPSNKALSTLLAGFAVPAPDLEVSGLALDSRQVAPGDLFVALRGIASHGLAHLDQAIERGASAVIWEPAPGLAEPEGPIPDIALPGLSARIGEIAARFRGHPSKALFVAGITGTDGKTSTAHLLAQALDSLGEPCAYFGTLGHGRLGALDNSLHTTPDAVRLQQQLADSLAAGCRAVAMEVSSHALAQHRVGGVAFDAAVLTNITRDHLDYHGTVEHYAAAKRRLFEPDDERFLILNRDDPWGARWIEDFSRLTSHASRLTGFAIGGEPGRSAREVLGRELRLHESGLSMRLETPWGTLPVESRLLGRFNAYNLMAAAAVLLNHGAAPEAVARALSSTHTVPGRIEGFRGPASEALAVVDYAHTPKALDQVLNALRAHTRGQLWCVFGCGGDRDRGKRPLMGATVAQLADRLIVTDDNPRSESAQAIVEEILSGIPRSASERLEVIHDRGSAIRSALRRAGAGDLVLIAGKGHETTQIYGSEVRAFSDRAFVADCLGMEPRP